MLTRLLWLLAHLWSYHEVGWQVDAGHRQAHTSSDLHVHKGQADKAATTTVHGTVTAQQDSLSGTHALASRKRQSFSCKI
jgi:hypothetical protein